MLDLMSLELLTMTVMWQAFGCVAAMFYISPKLTGLMAVVVTAIVTVGSLFGSVLRQLSRTSQAQVLSCLSSELVMVHVG